MNTRPKVYAISYSDDLYGMSKRINLYTAKHIGKADVVISMGPESLGESFKKRAAEILKYQRGAGYWCWKPYIILKVMRIMNEGDYLIYTDAGIIYVNKIQELIRQLERDKQDVFLSYGFAPCKDWCKRDAFVLMDCDCEEAKNSIMVSGGYVLVKKSKKSLGFIKEWQKYSMDSRIITDQPNTCGKKNYAGFREHRHDQAILSLLSWKLKVEPYKAVSLVDEPRSHLKIKKGGVDAYRYSYHKRLELMIKEHGTKGYKKSDYGRMFVNTRLKNCNRMIYAWNMVRVIIRTIKTDAWGKKHDKEELEMAKQRQLRNKEEIKA